MKFSVLRSLLIARAAADVSANVIKTFLCFCQGCSYLLDPMVTILHGSSEEPVGVDGSGMVASAARCNINNLLFQRLNYASGSHRDHKIFSFSLIADCMCAAN